MQAFIVRPFGIKNGIDFDCIDRELISPVLEELRIIGRTTAEIAEAGNIRADVFERLVLADLVIADISVHNANVYYELGVRHALRPRATILIRCASDDVPFDLKTDRYLEYDVTNPSAARAALKETIQATFAKKKVDSPLYLMLPALKAPDSSSLVPLPLPFLADVDRARSAGNLSVLLMLADEAGFFSWNYSGKFAVAQALFTLGALAPARVVWEDLREARPGDPVPALKLATVYQRLGDVAASEQLVDQVIQSGPGSGADAAEAWALAGSNWKTRWMESWKDQPAGSRAGAALKSVSLRNAVHAYENGFREDLNAFYPGLNALALNCLRLELIKKEPALWNDLHDSIEEADRCLMLLRERHRRLAGAVLEALTAARERHEKRQTYDVWLDLSAADYQFLTEPNPGRARLAYEAARENHDRHVAGKKVPETFPVSSALRQIRMFRDLGVFEEKAMAAIAGLGPTDDTAVAPPPPDRQILVFTGHRVDDPDRLIPRFPNTPECERLVREEIRRIVEAELNQAGARDARTLALAGAASGGDILFQEICREAGIPGRLLLVLPPAKYIPKSVRSSPVDWTPRFDRLAAGLPMEVLAETEELPEWLAGKKDYTIWERNNLWTLAFALSYPNARVTLIALWNGEGGDGPGGTADMIRLAEHHGVEVRTIDTKKLLADFLKH